MRREEIALEPVQTPRTAQLSATPDSSRNIRSTVRPNGGRSRLRRRNQLQQVVMATLPKLVIARRSRLPEVVTARRRRRILQVAARQLPTTQMRRSDSTRAATTTLGSVLKSTSVRVVAEPQLLGDGDFGSNTNSLSGKNLRTSGTSPRTREVPVWVAEMPTCGPSPKSNLRAA